ncbi:MAG: hypothetical protein E7559_09445 [Ruminococcaceae bacterium]|nr:hypothetical protein [Oscillospiraceae bacterium]
MYIYELRYRRKLTKDGQPDKRFAEAEQDLFKQLVRCGLVLEGGGWLYEKDGELRRRFIAVTKEAMDPRQMSYDARQSWKAVLKLSEEPPKAVCLQECLSPAHCTCKKPGFLVMQSPAEWEGTPICCGDCRKSYPIYRLERDPLEREFDDLLHWSKLRRGYIEQYMTGAERVISHEALQGCVSDLSLQGRRLAGMVETATGILTLYPLFAYYEKAPSRCPQCGGEWVNRYRDAIPFEFFCRSCRLVM